MIVSSLKFLRPAINSLLGLFDNFGIKLLNRLRFGFGHLIENKFERNFSGNYKSWRFFRLKTG